MELSSREEPDQENGIGWNVRYGQSACWRPSKRGVKGGVWFSLVDKVFREDTLEAAWRTVKRNRGGAGTDHQSIEAFERNLPEEMARLSEELREGTYRPRPIRREYIDKPGSKEKRPLGIPCVRDRVVQAALRLVIEPIFEREFEAHSYGFRPGRGCKDALREVDRLLQGGYTYVVDADLRRTSTAFRTVRCWRISGNILPMGGCWVCWKPSSSRTSWRD